MTHRGVAVGLGVLALAGISGEAFAKNDIPGFLGLPKVKNFVRIKRPKLKFFKQNDLAATNLVATTEGDIAQGNAKLVLIGTCRNLGAKMYQSSQRLVRIEKKAGETWTPLGEKAVPPLLPGQTFTVSLKLPATETGEFRLVVTPGTAADENPENDLFIPQSEGGEEQTEPAPLDPPMTSATGGAAPATPAAPAEPAPPPAAPAEPAK